MLVPAGVLEYDRDSGGKAISPLQFMQMVAEYLWSVRQCSSGALGIPSLDFRNVSLIP